MRLGFVITLLAVMSLACADGATSSTGATSSSTSDDDDDGGGRVCCKYCGTDSKACGDSCISNDKQCHTSGGCACEGNAPT